MTAQAESPRGRVRVAAPMSFGISHLAPALPEFMARYPDVALEVDFRDELTDLVAQGFDLALRISTLADSSLLAQRLCAVRILLVGAPLYFERHGRPAHPRELAQHRALFYTHTRPGDAWRFQHPVEGEFALVMASSLRANNAEALEPALLAGMGLALQPEFLVWQALQDGRLETALAGWVVPPIALHIVTPPSRARAARVQVLIDFLAERFAHAPWAHHAGLSPDANR